MSAEKVLQFAILDAFGYPKPLIDLPFYAWPGGYPIIYLTEAGEILCAECATKEIRAWMYDESTDPPTAYDAYYEGPTERCADCNREIESAYGDPEENNGTPQ